MVTVLANGCFDILHVGHVAHLRSARELGDRLVVALTVDEAVTAEKGPGRPINTWEHRAAVLMELRCVDDVVRSKSGVDAIATVKPNLFVKGSDYLLDPMIEETAACEKVGAKLYFTTTAKFSTAGIIERVKKCT